MKIQATGMLLFTLFFMEGVIAQTNPLKRLENRVKNRVAQKVNREVDKSVDDVLDGKPKSGSTKSGSTSPGGGTTNNENGDVETSGPDGEISANKAAKPKLESYSKFDFVPGDLIVGEEDFSQDAIGDFPDRWNTNGSAEVVTLNNIPGKWLKIGDSKSISFIPDIFNKSMPENFTMEFDLVYNNWNKEYAYQRLLTFTFHEVPKPDHRIQYDGGGSGFMFTFNGAMGSGSMRINQLDKNGSNTQLSSSKDISSINPDNNGKVFHVSVWRQKSRVRVYLDENKIFDLPRILEPGVNLNSFKIFAQISQENKPIFVSNIRMASGNPDTRNKLVTEGKFVTSGITFDFQSAVLKPESYGILKEIASVLTENEAMKIQIVGHTSNDGDAAANMELSKLRAAAVKNALEKEFKINANRITTDGKGGAQPAYPTTTPQGKAANRRVEFIKT